MRVRDAFPAVAFGTSGLRALVSDLTDDAVANYARAFVLHLRREGVAVTRALIGWDLRPSSPAMAAAVARGLASVDVDTLLLGAIPTPALALAALARGWPAVMVTGSHIPFDRNGVKFYRPDGEISKRDEAGMGDVERVSNPASSVTATMNSEAQAWAVGAYMARARVVLGDAGLAGMRVGVHQHSSVARDLLLRALEAAGAQVVALGRQDSFVPVDTEAVSEEDEARAAAWCREHGLQALVSTDGDGDRPLVFDERGRFIPGDVLGVLTARALGVAQVATPVNANSWVLASGWFVRVARTRIGSPHVIEAMTQLASAHPQATTGGFEANGGFLLQTPARVGEATLDALPTRDALLPIAAVLGYAKREGVPLSHLREVWPTRFTASGRLQGVDAQRMRAAVATFASVQLREHAAAVDLTDGVRVTLESGDIVHVRPSGNAPELRVYTESNREDAARALRDETLHVWRATLQV